MKLQNLSIIFIIIIIPIILVVSYYISMQIDTINMQTSYNTKLLEATKEAIESFEINTVEWNAAYSETADSKRRDVMASINTFTNSFANSIGVGGATKETILAYVPAIAYTLYDGYYIYTPAETKEVIKDENETAVFMTEQLPSYKDEDEGKILYEYDSEKGGNSNGTINTQKNGKTENVQFTLNSEYAKTDYSHILKPFASYSARYVNGGTDITVNYTLDNYITIYGTVGIGKEYSIRSGYLIDTEKIKFEEGTINNIFFDGKKILPESLEEKIWYEGLNKPTTFRYIYASDNTKVYFDGSTAFQVSSTGKRTDLNDTNTIKYKKLSVLSSKENKYYEIYQALNGENQGTWYSNTTKLTKAGNVGQENYDLKKDFSSINYYVESYCFTKWVKSELGNITIGDIPNVDTSLYGDEGTKIFDISNANDPEKDNSAFSLHKREVIKQSLISNLNQAITSYSRNSEGEYQLPVLTETDWDKVLDNVSIITFVQGIPIGLKNYNNYAIATSTANKEYVNPDEIYITSTSINEKYYHLPNCSHIIDEGTIIGYRNTDYLIQAENNADISSYYKHEDLSREACYYCIVDRASYDKENDSNVQLAYDTALGRERYNNRTTVNTISKVSADIETNRVTVTYIDANEEIISSDFVQKGTEIIIQKPKAYPGYKTVWYEEGTDKEYNGGETYEVNASVAFRLIKKELHTITFKLNNGKADIVKEYLAGQSIEKPNNPTKAGCTFDKWSPDVPATMPNHDLTVEAKWIEQTYTITLDYNDGSGRKDTITGTYDQTKTLPTITSNKQKTFFNGWSDSPNATEGNITRITIKGDKTYYATWVTGVVAKYKDKYYPKLQQAIDQIKLRRNLGRSKCVFNSQYNGGYQDKF